MMVPPATIAILQAGMPALRHQIPRPRFAESPGRTFVLRTVHHRSSPVRLCRVFGPIAASCQLYRGTHTTRKKALVRNKKLDLWQNLFLPPNPREVRPHSTCVRRRRSSPASFPRRGERRLTGFRAAGCGAAQHGGQNSIIKLDVGFDPPGAGKITWQGL